MKPCLDQASLSPHFRKITFSGLAAEFIKLQQIDPKSALVAIWYLLVVKNDREFDGYKRNDARIWLEYLIEAGNKMATICLSFCYCQCDNGVNIYMLNPFFPRDDSRKRIYKAKRWTFSPDQLEADYDEALVSETNVLILFPSFWKNRLSIYWSRQAASCWDKFVGP